MGAVTAEGFVDDFESTNEIDDLGARVRSPGCCAKVGAAAKWSVRVDETTSGAWIEEWASSVGAFRKRAAPGGSQSAGGKTGFATGELRGAARDLEVATFRPERASAFDGTFREFGVDGPDFSEGGGLSGIQPRERATPFHEARGSG